MSNFSSIIERTVYLQLQRYTPPHLRTPIQFFVAFAVVSGFSIVRRVSSASVSAPVATLTKALTGCGSGTSEGVPLLNTLFCILTRALNAACLRVRIHVRLPVQWRQLFSRGDGKDQSDITYATSRAEAKYWRVAGRYRRRLYSGNSIVSSPSNHSIVSREDAPIPLVTYYTPRLLPLYRDRTGQTNADAHEGRISPKTFCKWHRMVFQNACPLTLARAAVEMKYYSRRDLREIQRIARLLPDEQAFGAKGEKMRRIKGTTKYGEMWRSWLENKGMDLVIVFE